MEIRIFLIVSYLLGLAFSIETTWIRSFKICADNNQRMSTEDDVVKNNTWLGKAKYELTGGVITLQLLKIEKNETCSLTDCHIHQKNCQFCESPVKLNEVSSSFEELRPNLTSEKKYIIEGSWSGDVEEFPMSTVCLVYRGASITEYVSCNKFFNDGCKQSDGEYKVIIYLEENHKEGTSTQSSVVSTLETIRVTNGKSECVLPNFKCIFSVAVGFCCILIIINVLCVCCCVNYQVNRKLRSLRIQQINDNSCKPISEAITRMYKSINAFKEEQNETYDLTASVRKKSNLAITSGMDDKNNYDTGLFRLLTQRGDYDTAWSNPCTSPTSPDAEYDQVQNVGAALMTFSPEEDVYSKQRPLIQEIYSDFNEICYDENENPKDLLSEKTTKSISGFFNVEKNSGTHDLDKFQRSDVKNTVGNAKPDKGTQQKQNIVYEDNSKTHQKEHSLTDEAFEENGKKTTDIETDKNLEMGVKQGTQSGKRYAKKSKVHTESKSGSNPPEYTHIIKGDPTKTSSSQRVGKVVDKATSLLVANMNRVMSETKL